MKDRILQFLTAENISQTQLAENINFTRAGISHIISGRNNPSYDFIEKIAKHYPNLNLDWLIMGKGKMYKLNDDNVNSLFTASELQDNANKEEYTPSTSSSKQSNTILSPAIPSTPLQEHKPSPEPLKPEQPPKKAIKAPRISKIIVLYEDGSFKELD